MDLNCLAILDGMFSDTNSRWLFWDRPEESLFGPFLDLIHPDDIKSTLQALENLSCATSVIDFRQQYRKKHRHICLQWNAYLSDSGEELIIPLLVLSITWYFLNIHWKK